MPIYEYECHVCGHRLEKLQKISDAPLTDCPACEEPGLRKLVSAVAFRLKGAGWYETDFKDEKTRKNLSRKDEKPGDADSARTAAGEDKSEGKSKAGEAKIESGSASKETKSATQPRGGSASASSPPG